MTNAATQEKTAKHRYNRPTTSYRSDEGKTPIVVSAKGAHHRLANPIESLGQNSLMRTSVVLIACEEDLDGSIAKVQSLGAERIMPVDPASVDLDGDIDRALSVLSVARTSNSCKKPSLGLLKAARACQAPMPKDTFGAVQNEVERAARIAGAPVEFLAGTLLGLTSALATGRFTVRVREGFEVPPLVWFGLVGDASSGKSPAMDFIIKIVRKIEADGNRAYGEACETAKAAGQKIDTVPLPRRVMVSNSSIEALQHIAAEQGRGLLYFFDELSDFFNSLNRYSKSAQGDRGQLLSAHNAYPAVVDRRSMKVPLSIDCWGVSVLGAIPPSVLASLSATQELQVDDGLDVRMSYLYPSLPPIALRPDAADFGVNGTFERMIRRMFEWRLQARKNQVLEFDAAARDKFEGWRFALLQDARRSSTEVSSWVGKLPGLVARLAGVLCVLDAAHAGTETASITTDHLKRAGRFADLLTAHRRKVELVRGAPTMERLAAELAAFIVTHRLASIDTFEIRRGAIVGIRTEKILRAVLLELHSAGWLETYISARNDEPLPVTVVVKPEVFHVAEGLQ
jgi:hypothetical protein